MRTMKTFLGVAMLALLVGCSSGGDEDTLSVGNGPDPVDPTLPDPVVVASIEVLTSNPQIPSDGGVPVTITALLRDVNNNFVAGENVTFSADSGGLSVTQDPNIGGAPQAVTDANGRATAELSAAGDPTNRVISVTANTGDLSAGVQVEVTGTQLTIAGPATLVQNATATYTIVLSDAAGNGIANQTVNITSSNGNTLASQTLTTDFIGQTQVEYTAVNSGADSLTASALGESTTSTVNISGDTFGFESPAANAEIDLGAMQEITVRWQDSSGPRAGQTVIFSTTRGTVAPASVVTNANGVASTMVTADNSGPASVTASTIDGPEASLPIEFVAVTPETIEVQADPFTVAPNSQSTITAVVRDPAGNLVKNKRITFILDDVTGGTLSVSSSVTDSQGRAQTSYTSSVTTSSVDGVTITAEVDEDTTIFDTVNLTVAGREVFFTFGTGNTITEPNAAQYEKLYVVQVTDADGRAVQNVDVAMSVVSVNYVKGFWWVDTGANAWSSENRELCADEDQNRNGILDLDLMEDFNNSGQLEAGNVATVSPGNFISDNRGEGLVTLAYPQEFGGWLEVELQARASVQGTEFSEKAFFVLPVLADDVNDVEQSPPGRLVFVNDFDSTNLDQDVLDGIDFEGTEAELFSSPFGYNQDCNVWEFTR